MAVEPKLLQMITRPANAAVERVFVDAGRGVAPAGDFPFPRRGVLYWVLRTDTVFSRGDAGAEATPRPAFSFFPRRVFAMSSEATEAKLAAAIDRLTAELRKANALAEGNGKVNQEVLEEMRAARESADSREFDATSSIVELLSAVGNMATSASLKLLIADESSVSPAPSPQKAPRAT